MLNYFLLMLYEIYEPHKVSSLMNIYIYIYLYLFIEEEEETEEISSSSFSSACSSS